MSISDNLAKAVSEHDIQAVRDCLAASIVFDPNMTLGFRESLRYVLGHGITEDELYQPHDGRSLDREETADAFPALCGELGTNFSRERIEAIRKLGCKLYPPGSDSNDNNEVCEGSGFQRQSDNMWPLVGLAVGGALVGGIVGALVLKKALWGLVGGVAGAAVGALVGNKIR